MIQSSKRKSALNCKITYILRISKESRKKIERNLKNLSSFE